ncbi:MAG: acetate--CoA ligase family protein [Nitrososphaerota archaeon]|nr:acetate--CoA ligase family protein [Nitrososphaerota archaeon]MDG7014110.1 acetate--CoA ligase family protein [Nitrososphaerota archaeon]MDG7025453.1 acetate--CoA ligase family protein [Nitrososphaerota archaeon]
MSLEPLFRPSSIAVVGASREKSKIGNIILRNLMGTYNGKILPINPSAEVVEGIPAFRSLADARAPVDLMVVAVPREIVPKVVGEAIESGVKAGIIITSGFREADAIGAKLEAEITEAASKSGLRLLGPNTLGLITRRFNATFSFSDVKVGGLALVSQSGGIGVYMLNWAHRTRTGLSHFVSLGNQCNVTEADVYEYLSTDEETKAIFSYNEGVANGKAFLETVSRVTTKKPIVFLKGGLGKKGAEAVKTHTGSLAGSSELFRAAVRTCGGIYVESLEEFLDLAKLVLSGEKVQPEILLITNSGGHGVLATDEIERQGLSLAKLPDEISKKLRSILPVQSLPKNPLDLSGDADAARYSAALNSVQDIDCTKVVMVQSLPTISCSEFARVLLNYKGNSVMGVVMGMDEEAAVRTLESSGVPAYRFPEDAIRSLNHLISRHNPIVKKPTSNPPQEASRVVSGKSYLSDDDAFRIMRIYGLGTAKWGIASEVREAEQTADRIGCPVVMKISTDSPTHKTELGGVRVNVERNEVSTAFQELSKISPRVLIQQQLSGAEIFIGGIDDATFGKAVVVGLGGTYVEVFKTLSYGLCPLYEEEARDMLEQSKVSELLSARKRNYDETSVVDSLTKISRMIVDLDVKQLDVNPVIVNESGSYVVDARIVLSSS